MKRILAVLVLIVTLAPVAFAVSVFTNEGDKYVQFGATPRFYYGSPSGVLNWLDPAENVMMTLTDNGTTATLNVDTVTATNIGGTNVTASKFVGSGSTTDAVDLATAEVAGVLPLANGGTSGTSATTAASALGLGIEDTANFTAIGLGVEDTTAGSLFGSGNNDVTGFVFRLYNAANEDTSVDYWNITANGDFEIGAYGTPKITIDDATGAVSFAVPLADAQVVDDLTINSTHTITGPGITASGVFSTTTVTAITANDTTPAVTAGNIFRIPGTWTAGNNITMFDGGVAGQTILILGGDLDCTVVKSANMALESDWVAATGCCISLTFDGVVWNEVPVRGGTRTFTFTSALTNAAANSIVSAHTTSGDMIDGFGAGIMFQATDSGAGPVNLGMVQGVRDSADTEAALKFYTGTNGLELAATFDHNLTATFAGLIQTVASAAVAGAGLNVPHGVVPNNPVNGDLWTTTAGVFARINGVSEQLTTASGGAFSTLSVTGSASIGTTAGGLNVGSAAVSANADGEARFNVTDQGNYNIQGGTYIMTGAGTLTGVVTASNAANAINIGTSSTMTIPPDIGGTTPNGGWFNELYARDDTSLGSELVTVNPDMELTTGWTVFGSPDSQARSNEQAHAGTYSWKVVSNAINQGFTQTFDTKGIGVRYKVTFWYYGAGNITSRIRYTGVATMGETTVAASAAWTQGTYYASVTQTCPLDVQFYAATGAQTFYIDDVSVKQVGGSGRVNGTFGVGGASTFNGLVTTVGGVHVGGTSDPGTDNLTVDGTSTLTGVVTATAAANVINIGTSCTMGSPPAIGGTVPNSAVFTRMGTTQITITANDTTPSVAGGNVFFVPGTGWTAGNNITAFDEAIIGQSITIVGGDSDCVIDDGVMKLTGSFTASTGNTLQLVFAGGGTWWEVSRAAPGV